MEGAHTEEAWLRLREHYGIALDILRGTQLACLDHAKLTLGADSDPVHESIKGVTNALALEMRGPPENRQAIATARAGLLRAWANVIEATVRDHADAMAAWQDFEERRVGIAPGHEGSRDG